MSASERCAEGRGVRASSLVGARPRDAVGRVSSAVRRALASRVDEGAAAVVLAVSGGADSLALGVCAVDVCARAGLPVLSVTVDHGLREGSGAEAAHVATLMRSMGAVARTVTVDATTRERGDGPEGDARSARLAALAAVAGDWGREVGATRVCVLLGHTMDDQAETVLLGLARGSGAGSLRGMAPEAEAAPEAPVGREGVQVRWLRPLLGVRRADTKACCAQLGLQWVDDPTNRADGPWRAADGSALRRAAVREEALPALAHALGIDPVPALARSARLMARDDDALEAEARGVRARVELGAAEALGRVGDAVRGRGGDPEAVVPRWCLDGAFLDALALSQVVPALRDRVVHGLLVEVSGRGGSVTSRHVAGVVGLVTDWHGQGPLDVPGACVMRLPGGVVAVAARP